MNAFYWALAAGAGVGLAGLGWIVWRWRRAARQETRIESARRQFQQRREWFEARFFTISSQSGKPRGLIWVDCDFQKEVAFARQRESGRLQAFVGVLIRFRAVEGGDLEDNPNVGNVRAATAVFSFVDGTWDTEGRTVFNLNPAQTIQHFQHELELVK